MTEDPRFYTVDDVAGMLGVNPATVRRNLKTWPHMRIGSKLVRFSQSDIDGIVELCKAKAEPREPETFRPRLGIQSRRRKTRA